MDFAKNAMRRLVAVMVFGAVSGLVHSAAAEEGVTRAQVEELQKQLASMQKNMEEMEAAMKANEQRGSDMSGMHGHMMRMRTDWQHMPDQTCTMNPAGCAHMGGGHMGGSGSPKR